MKMKITAEIVEPKEKVNPLTWLFSNVAITMGLIAGPIMGYTIISVLTSIVIGLLFLMSLLVLLLHQTTIGHGKEEKFVLHMRESMRRMRVRETIEAAFLAVNIALTIYSECYGLTALLAIILIIKASTYARCILYRTAEEKAAKGAG